MASDTNSWFPLFEFAEWSYQSFLLLPTEDEKSAAPGTTITAKKWANGIVGLGQAFKTGDHRYEVTGVVSNDKLKLTLSAKGGFGVGDTPGMFEATVTGNEGPAKGAVSQLIGWVFADEPVVQGARRVRSIRGSVRAVRGPDTKPELDLSGMPLGTVGSFVILRVA